MATPELVGQLAVDGSSHRRGEQVDRHDPDVELVARQIGHDPRQRGADHRLVECREEDRQQDRAQDLHPGAVVDMDGGVVRQRLVRHDGGVIGLIIGATTILSNAIVAVAHS